MSENEELLGDAVAPSIDPDVQNIVTKYGNDINKMAKAYKSMQSFKTPPSEYEVGEQFKELSESSINKFKSLAKKSDFTQKQFDSLLNQVLEDKAQRDNSLKSQKALREAALGGEDEIEKLRSFYKDTISESLLNKILSTGTPEEINDLKRMRNNMFDKTISKPEGDGEVGESHLSRELQVEKLRQELRGKVDERINGKNGVMMSITEQRAALLEEEMIAAKLQQLTKIHAGE